MIDSQKFVCRKCNKEEEDNSTNVAHCVKCKSTFHIDCVRPNDNMLSWMCEFCLELSVPLAPRSNRSKSHRSHTSSNHSQRLILQKLEEERALLQRSIDEKLQVEKEFLQKKYEILQNEGSRASGSQISSKSKVEQWIQDNSVEVDPSLVSKELSSTMINIVSTTVNEVSIPITASSIPKPIMSYESQTVDLTNTTQTFGTAVTPCIYNGPKNIGSLTCSAYGQHPAISTTTSYPVSSEVRPSVSQQEKASVIISSQSNPVNTTYELPNQTKLAAPFFKFSTTCSFPNKVPFFHQQHMPSSTFTYPSLSVPVISQQPLISNNIPHQMPIEQSQNHTQKSMLYAHDLSASASQARKVISTELPKFGGKPADWPEFISAYEFTTSVCELTEFENASRLHRSLKGVAFSAVQSTLYLPDGASNAINTLRRLFGQPEFIINELLEELRQSGKPTCDVDSIIQYSLKVDHVCATMKKASLQDHLKNPILLQELVNYLPSNFLYEWATFKHGRVSTDLEVFSSWLRGKADVLLSILKTAPFQTSLAKDPVNVHFISQANNKCVACKGTCSLLADCNHFIQLKLSDKWNIIKDNGICRTCLKKHEGDCKFKKRCGVNDCTFYHHKLLHNYNKTIVPKESKREGIINIHKVKEVHQDILFKIVPVKLSKQGKEVNTYAFLDDGSSLTLIEQSLASSLGISGTNVPLHLQWTGDTTRSELSSEIISFEICGLHASKKFNVDQVRTVKNLNLPRQTQSNEEFQKYKHLRGVPFPTFHNAEPQLLIGLPHAKLLATSKIRMGNTNEPSAAKTPLGWVMYGPTEINVHSLFHIRETMSDVLLEEEVKNYFSLESLGITHKKVDVESAEESRAKSIMEKTTELKDDYFETGLIWRFDNVNLPSSFENAKRRYLQLEKRLQKEPELAKIVHSQIQEYLSKGYARVIPKAEIEATNSNCWHLPIFVVINPNKPGKIRLVWDAASKVGNISLNTMLLKGPDMLISLPGILRRFREKNIAITADIKEMFHRVHIRKEDQPFQRFLWRFNKESELTILCMNVMTFGSSCSPASANYVLNLNAERFQNEYPNAVNSIRKSHYVDDLLECCDTQEEAIKLAEDIRFVHSKGGFQIRNRTSNDVNVRRILNLGSGEDAKFELSSDNNTEKVLGFWWETKSDCFLFSLKFNKSNKAILCGNQIPSKRDILRTIMSIFDPLGLISDILVHPRILLQEVWRAGFSWDEPISNPLFEQWKSWIINLSNIEDLRIPRCYGLLKGCNVELHTFVDSSEDAFACAIYARIITEESIKCVLIASKSKVAPLKPISMPRLELQAALIGARQAAKVKEEQNFTVLREFYWSDSETVLCWLKSDARRYRQFVAVRVGEILELSNSSDWRYVPTKLNVADVATRKLVVKIDSESTWFKGPNFLYEPEANWPKNKPKSITKEEIRSHFVHCELYFHTEGLVDVEGKSSWARVRRSQAYVIRFINNCKAKIGKDEVCFQVGPISREEYRAAQNFLFKKCQQNGFSEEYVCLQNQPPLQVRRSSTIYKDSPFLDETGVMRANSRLSGSDNIPEAVKKPIILPKSHKITDLLLHFYHLKYHHINGETAVNEVRQLFVIHALRVQMKKITFNCQFCKNRRAKPLVPFMSNLPDARLGCFTRPFSFIGIDYFGPLYVRVRRVNEKRWGVIITCLTVRAVHIELASSLSTDSCIMCLQRFISRRGQPLEIYSDNGKNLRGASKELKIALQSIDQNQLAEKFNSEVTQWMFIPPSAPHMGGAWERLVRSIKVALFSILPTRTPSEELLSTILAEVENMINSRPLTYVPLDTELDEALTPNHFLLGSSSGKKPFGKFSPNVWILRNNWKKAEEYLDRLWQKWKMVYLPEIRKRHAFNDHFPNAKVGDIAVLCDDDQPRNQWPKVKILAVYPGKDGRVRRVTIKTKNGVLERPVSKLAILEVSNNTSTSPNEVEVPGGLLTEAPEHDQSR